MLDIFKIPFESEALKGLQNLASTLLPLEANLNISGNPGTGKTLWATGILDTSVGSGNYKKIDIKSLDEDKFKIELENHGLRHVLLENFEYLHKDNQAILYNYIQTKSLLQRPVIVTTSRRGLAELAKEGLLRQDLYYKLSVFNLCLPDLKNTKADVKVYAQVFLGHFTKLYKKVNIVFSTEAILKLESFFWSGNISELENVIERAVLMCEGEIILDRHIRFDEFQKFNPLDLSLGMSLSEVERRLILQTLEHTQNNRTKAAHILGISIRTLRNKLNEYREAGLI